MDQFLASAVVFSLSQLSLSIALLALNRRSWSIQEKLLFILLIATVSYLVVPSSQGYWFQSALLIIQTLLPGIFWLFCTSLFDERFKLHSWSISLIAVSVLFPFIGKIMQEANLPAPTLLFRVLPQTLEFVFLTLAFVVIIRSWRADLVQTRRNLRLWFCAVVGLYMFTLVVMREILFHGADWLENWQYLPIGIICMMTNILLLQYKPGLLHLGNKKNGFSSKAVNPEQYNHLDSTAKTNSATEQLDLPEDVMQELNRLLEKDHIYREMGLTIGQLADKLELPEYRLRKIINTGLGYRNFNDFLNGYRIKEAGERLVSPDMSEKTILNIALDIGFRSLSSFNKAFKESYGQTPTEFRNQHHQKSKNDKPN